MYWVDRRSHFRIFVSSFPGFGVQLGPQNHLLYTVLQKKSTTIHPFVQPKIKLVHVKISIYWETIYHLQILMLFILNVTAYVPQHWSRRPCSGTWVLTKVLNSLNEYLRFYTLEIYHGLLVLYIATMNEPRSCDVWNVRPWPQYGQSGGTYVWFWDGEIICISTIDTCQQVLGI